MKNIIKDIFYRSVSLFDYKRVVILMYHSIADNKEFFSVKLSSFQEQMSYLYRCKFNVISFADLVGGLQDKKKFIKGHL